MDLFVGAVFGEATTSYNTAFTKLAKMNVVGTLREFPERYMPSHIGELFGVNDLGLL